MQQNIEPLKQLHSEKFHSEKVHSEKLHSEKVKSAGQVFLTIHFFLPCPLSSFYLYLQPSVSGLNITTVSNYPFGGNKC